ncbi:hypothetical protein [Ralstonia pseudosolanacearum]|uniref:Uncharacterized protein n=1 Tax=Ralstonia solanacearum TaxID=305 RepID=A0AA92JZK1_RALSL|nr:hypothetical protein [Ralstonia pseudosolanacearum]QOK90723.1 hypothetical protein HF908_03990 [Ralstonia pseudosolanacearum]QOK95651.1 hypothetical protein HF909_03845 [Ralstonia pseudosolanacearum]UWD91679.1 hypothetical protein NY025_11805 [Ralstonia pseudosolanacearum]
MFNLVAFAKPVLDEITGQDVRTWSTGSCVLEANWQVPELGSRIWRARALRIAFTQDVADQLMHADRRDLCQLQCVLDRLLRARLGMPAEAGLRGQMIVITVDHLWVGA